MIRWQKKGCIFSHNSFKLSWFRKNAMVPLPYLKDSETIRIFTTFCDEKNIGRIGYVDVDSHNPSKIIRVSKTPLLDIGENGKFDDNGVVTASIYQENNRLYLFYSGYQLCIKVPYMIFSGVAVSYDKGDTFTKITDKVPLLDRIDGEWGTRCVPFVIRENDIYKMWYTADADVPWCINDAGKQEPYYDLKYIESSQLLLWKTDSTTALSFENEKEHGIGMGTLWKEGGYYRLIFTCRMKDGSASLGYALSKDGKKFSRDNNGMAFEMLDEEKSFDDEMMCYADRIQVEDRVYLFYSGNHYGMGGVGYAELVKNE